MGFVYVFFFLFVDLYSFLEDVSEDSDLGGHHYLHYLEMSLIF